MMNNSLSDPYNILVDACLLALSFFSFPMEIIALTFYNSYRFMKVGTNKKTKSFLEEQAILNL